MDIVPSKKGPIWVEKHWIPLVVILVVAIVAAYMFTSILVGDFFSSGSGFEGYMEGSVSTISAKSPELIGNFSIASPSVINGSYGATGTFTFLAMNQSELSDFILSGAAPSYLFEEGNSTSGAVNFSVGIGTVFLVFLNPNSVPITFHFSFEATKIP